MKLYKVLAMFVVVSGVSLVHAAQRQNQVVAEYRQAQQRMVYLKQQAEAHQKKQQVVSAFNGKKAQKNTRLNQPSKNNYN